MKNVSIPLPDHEARQARVWAVDADTRVSQFLGRMLTERMEREMTSPPCLRGSRWLLPGRLFQKLGKSKVCRSVTRSARTSILR